MIEGPWRLAARPSAEVTRPVAPGIRELGSGALLHVPPAEGPLPLAVLFHGAGSSARAGVRLLEQPGVVLLAPEWPARPGTRSSAGSAPT